MNEKIKELIDWCQEETDIIEGLEYKSLSNHMWAITLGKKAILDAVKDKLCSIYEEPSEKVQIEEFVNSVHRDTLDEFDDYTHGWNGALREVLEFISKM